MRNIIPEIIAPDRFTGSEAQVLIRRVAHNESLIEQHIEGHPDQTLKFDRRIAVLESLMETVIKNQQRIIDKLDEL